MAGLTNLPDSGRCAILRYSHLPSPRSLRLFSKVQDENRSQR
jgi:hypothetical protein